MNLKTRYSIQTFFLDPLCFLLMLIAVIVLATRCGRAVEQQKQFCIAGQAIFEKPEAMPGEGYGRWVQIDVNKWVYYKDSSCSSDPKVQQ